MLKRVCLPSYGKDRLRRTDLCKTKAGNSCEMLIITNFTSSQDAIAERKCIIICSRVHPGESNASFIMEGFLEFIVSNDREAKSLRDTFVFKIVPMLNPDGVIVGNYRCSLTGLDLNRQWQNPNAKLSTEIYAMKEMIRKTLECRQIHLFIDIHGHSRQSNLFLYGC
jgi:murein tripeptide amidase MpaA